MVGGLVLFAEKGGMRGLHPGRLFFFFLPVGLTSWQGFFAFFFPLLLVLAPVLTSLFFIFSRDCDLSEYLLLLFSYFFSVGFSRFFYVMVFWRKSQSDRYGR